MTQRPLTVNADRLRTSYEPAHKDTESLFNVLDVIKMLSFYTYLIIPYSYTTSTYLYLYKRLSIFFNNFRTTKVFT